MTALTDQPPINSCSSIAGPPRRLPGGRLASLSAELERWPELGLKTLAYHLGQSDATAADGHWHAAVHEARSFLEALVLGMALAVRAEAPEQFNRATDSQSRFRLCRGYLVELGFIDADENDLLLHVFAIGSAKGSHPGVTDEAWCRLARQFVRSTAAYFIQRYAAWRSLAFRPSTGPLRSGSSAGPCPERGAA